MEYIVSARKYRPMTFDSVVGQSSLTTTLKNAVTSGKLAHAYLFCGPRGVGKTTCARIFAKVINCMSPTTTGDACGECDSCRAFNEGRSLNIFELDAASNNGVDHIKTLMEQTRIPPQTGKYKVFIIDEVHMLSTQAFNAFLKTLEEPPAHVIFILATTEKHKILPTIISRCQIYDFERMTVPSIINHLKSVAEKEGITYEEEALNVIAEKADGGMRDALSIFDQTASFCQGNITYEKVLEDLNVLDSDNYFKIIDLALENKVSDIMLTLDKILSHGYDAGKFITGLASHLRNVLMSANPQTTQLIETSDSQRNKYAEQAKRCKSSFIYKALKILNDCDIDYRQSSNKRLLCELSLIQVAQITQPDDTDSAGRCPARRLKSLFKKALEKVQSTTEVPQVTQTAQPISNNQQEAANNTQVNITTQSSSQSKKIKLSDVGMSFAHIMVKPKIEQTAEVANDNPTNNEHQSFTEDDVRREWLSMCNRMMNNKDLTAIAMRMQNVQLSISNFPHIIGIVENEILLNDVTKLLPRIKLTLAQTLHNGELTLELKLGQREEIVHKLPPREFIAEITKKNKDFASFKDRLQLEIE